MQLIRYSCKAKQSSPATRHGGAWGESRYSSYSVLTSALDGGEWSASRLGRALLRERIPCIHCARGWVGLRAGLDTEVTVKILCPCRGSNPNRPVVQSVVRHYTDWATPAPNYIVVSPEIWVGFGRCGKWAHISCAADDEEDVTSVLVCASCTKTNNERRVPFYLMASFRLATLVLVVVVLLVLVY
jgi:hypothetical protein